MVQKNSLSRKVMLSGRAIRRELREYGYWQNYGMEGIRFVAMERPEVTPAWMNRRTGKPHEHLRERARRILRNVRHMGLAEAVARWA